jgi:hypothetical protein
MFIRPIYFLRTIYCRQKTILPTTILAILLLIFPLPAHGQEAPDNGGASTNTFMPGDALAAGEWLKSSNIARVREPEAG